MAALHWRRASEPICWSEHSMVVRRRRCKRGCAGMSRRRDRGRRSPWMSSLVVAGAEKRWAAAGKVYCRGYIASECEAGARGLPGGHVWPWNPASPKRRTFHPHSIIYKKKKRGQQIRLGAARGETQLLMLSLPI